MFHVFTEVPYFRASGYYWKFVSTLSLTPPSPNFEEICRNIKKYEENMEGKTCLNEIDFSKVQAIFNIKEEQSHRYEYLKF